MKQLFQFAPFLFATPSQLAVLKKMGTQTNHIETACQDADGAFFLTTVIEEVSSGGDIERKRVVYEDSVSGNFDEFLELNAIDCEMSIIHLN